MDKKKIFDEVEFKNIKEVIYKSVEKYTSKVAFVIKHQENEKVEYQNITYHDFLEDINKVGAGLYSLGLKAKRIAIIGRNRYEWCVAHVSSLLGGMVSVPLDKDLQEDELENSLIRSKADCIIFDEKYIDKILEMKKRATTCLKEFICMSEIPGFKSIKGVKNEGEKLICAGNTEYVDYKIDDNSMSILLFTSGTTSQSKAVMLSQRNIASDIYTMRLVEDIRDTDTNIAFLPYHHIFGSTCMLMMVASGVRTVFTDGLRHIKKNFQEYGVSVFVGVPALIEAIYKTIMKEIDKKGKRKSFEAGLKISKFLKTFHIDVRRKLFKEIIDNLGGKLRFVISGGAPADPLIAEKFNELGIKTVQGYGLTETSPVIAAEDDKHMRRGSVGRPMIIDEIEIDNPDENGIGEIKVKGPNVMLGYYEMPEETDSVLKDGWFYTGDLGYFDKDGFLFITGRNKNVIVLRNGKKIFPEEIETVVARLPFVSEVMAFGMPDENDDTDFSLSIKLVYNQEFVNENYPDISEEELYKLIWNQIKELNTTFPKYKHIQNMILTKEPLIKTTTNKVKRQEEMKIILGK